MSKYATQRHVALTTTDTGTAVKFSWKGSLYIAAQRLGCCRRKQRHTDKYYSNSTAVRYKNVRGFIETLKEVIIKEHGGGKVALSVTASL